MCGQHNNGCGVIEHGYITHFFRTIPKCSFLILCDFFYYCIVNNIIPVDVFHDVTEKKTKKIILFGICVSKD